MASDIFISYAREDRRWTESLAHALIARNWTVFWDAEIRTGDAWRSELTRALDAARCVVVLWSKNSIEASFVCDEASRGHRRGILVSLTLGNVSPPLGFGETQIQKFPRGNLESGSEEFDRLTQAIERILKRPPEKTTNLRSKTSASAAENIPNFQKRSSGHQAVDRPKPKGEESFVSVPRARLDELGRTQERLGFFFDNHFRCHEVAELCLRLVERLDLWRTDKGRLSDDAYWRDLREHLQTTRTKALGLQHFFEEQCPDQISEFQDHLKTALSDCNNARDSTDNEERLKVAKSSFRSAETMRETIATITSMSRDAMIDLLKEIGRIVARLSERVEIASETTQQNNSAQAFGAKLRLPKPEAATRRGSKATAKQRRR